MSRLPFPFATRPRVIAHRGASGLLPEQTLEAFDLALEQGADAIEFDIVPTRDGKLLARHESELSLTTDVADRPEFTERKTTRVVEGETITGWFAEDFHARELRSLRARQRFSFRDASFDDRFPLATLDDILDWHARQARPIPLFIEMKHPTHFAGQGFDTAELLLETLRLYGASRSSIVVMSFETKVLRKLRGQSDLPIVQLLDAPNLRPADLRAASDPRRFADLLTSEGLQEIARYADGIGPWKRLIVPTSQPEADGSPVPAMPLAVPTRLVDEAHKAGLFVCTWTFRDEPHFLAREYAGNPVCEYRQFIELGLDGLISDSPATACQARKIQRSEVH